MSSLFEMTVIIKGTMHETLAIILRPVLGGWSVCLTDGRVLARFRGPGARFRALRFLSTGSPFAR